MNQSQIIKTINTFWFSSFRSNPFLSVTHLCNFFCNEFIAHSILVHLIKYPNCFGFFICQSAKQSRRIVCISKIKTKSRLHTCQSTDFIDVESFFFPIFKNKTIHNTPIAQSSYTVTAWIVSLHCLKNFSICFVQPFITKIIRGHGKRFFVWIIEESFFQKMMLIPRIKSQRNLLKQSCFWRYCSTYGFIKHVEIILVSNLICFLNPHKT